MPKKLTICFLYLLLMIPHHGNHPLPRGDSWLQSERDDGIVDEDMTSSLAGDEGFGSMRENHQNSLTHQRKSISSVSNSKSRIFDEQKYKNNERLEDLEPENLDAEYRDQNYLSGKSKAEPAFEEFEKNAEDSQNNRYQPTYNNRYQKSRLFSPQHYNNYRVNNRFMNPEPNSKSYLPNNFKKDHHTFMRNQDALRDCSKPSLCKPQKNKYAPDITLGVMEVLKLEGGSKKEKECDECNESKFRDSHELKDDFNKNEKISQRDIQKETDESMAEDYYYDPESKDTAVEGDEPTNVKTVEDYNQLHSHDAINKRDDTKSERKIFEKNTADVKSLDEKLESSKYGKSELIKDNVKCNGAVKEGHGDETDFQDAKLLWKMNSNLQAKELNNVMKDSQRALEEVKLFQQKMNFKDNNNEADEKFADSAPVSSYKENNKLMDNRDKREDEDEQKNMKTGTDEGGGEYEDEEGKGHNDDEEYYEEIEDIDEGEANLKRDTTKEEAKSSNSNSKSNDASNAEDDEDDEDDQLNFKNAPMENVQDQKKDPEEGEKKENNDIRKGAKIWDQWGKWSPCSVTCGVGRSVRWRHCIGGGCAKGEKEAQIKKCTNPAC